MCKKVKHKTTYQACQQIISLKRRKNNKAYGIYYCDKCSHYHVKAGDNLTNCEFIVKGKNYGR